MNIYNINTNSVASNKKVDNKKSTQKVTTSQSSINPNPSFKGLESLASQNMHLIHHSQKELPIEEDDGILGYDFGVYGSEGLDGAKVRADMRERILSRATLNDEVYTVRALDDSLHPTPQLEQNSKYYSLGEPKLNTKTQKYIYLCESLRDMPDGDGVRGKTPLTGKNINGLKYKLGKIKEAGIGTVIDLRTEGECSSKAMKVLNEVGLRYVNFPVEDKNWTTESVKNIASYINAINDGDYYVGCANGQARTDLAVAINYVFNPNAKNVPNLYFGTASSTRVSIKDNISDIQNIINENQDIIKSFGWDNYEEYSKTSSDRLRKLLNTLS